MLDRNIVSELVRNPEGRVTARIREVGEDNVGTSIIVAAELRYGAARKRSTRLLGQLEAILDALTILPFEAANEREFERIEGLRCENWPR